MARNLSPSILFNFESHHINNKKIVVLKIPAAEESPITFLREIFIRIGSSKTSLHRYPKYTIQLFNSLKSKDFAEIESPVQELTFGFLQTYYSSKGLKLKNELFKKELKLYIRNTKKYNLLAYLLADNNKISTRLNSFLGIDKTSVLNETKEFGNKCILNSYESILNFIDSKNVNIVNEKNRKIERTETELFNESALREALLNAFIHNDYIDMLGLQIFVFSNRIEILSYGLLPRNQIEEGFYDGLSIPRSKELSDVFLQLRLSERSKRGVTKIIRTYGKQAFKFVENSITVVIPFAANPNLENLNLSNHRLNNKQDKKLNQESLKVKITKSRIIDQILNNPYVSTSMLIETIGLKKTKIQKYLKDLKNEKKIQKSEIHKVDTEK
ncbi:ATP-binding protein [[Mycoplasma] testudinis]|uniref:ATP-binding protein n=1 Tax=[Mycoplasma] testudinis TaxID=33924 RepID=UPI000A943809